MRILQDRVAHQNTIVSLAFSPDGSRIVSGSWDGTAKVWDVLSGELLFTFAWGASQVNDVAWSPDGTTIAVAGDPPVRELNEKQLASYQAYFDHRDTSCFEGEDQGTNSCELRVYAADDGRFLRSFNGLGGGVAFSPDGCRMAVVSWPGLCIIECDSARTIAGYENESMNLRNVLFSTDGKQIACFSSDGAHVFDSTNANLVRTVPSHRSGYFPGECIDSEAGRIKRFWGRHLPEFRPVRCADQGSEMQRICFCPVRRTAAIVPDLHGKDVRLISNDGETLLRPRESGIRTASFSPDGSLLAVAGDGQTIRIWDMRSLAEGVPVGNPPTALASVGCAPTVPFIAAGNRDGEFGLFLIQRT